jgi:hypothetical protein
MNIQINIKNANLSQLSQLEEVAESKCGDVILDGGKNNEHYSIGETTIFLIEADLEIEFKINKQILTKIEELLNGKYASMSQID